jgi:hypothetical protein
MAVSVEQASEVIMAMYHDASRTKEANVWLTELQTRQEAWQLAAALLDTDTTEVRFYGANVLHQKCKSDINQLPSEARAVLMQQLITCLGTSAADAVRVQLCLATTALVVTAPETGNLHRDCQLSDEQTAWCDQLACKCMADFLRLCRRHHCPVVQ